MASTTLAFDILTRYKDAGARAAARDMDRLDKSTGRSSKSFSRFGVVARGAGGILGGIGFGMAIKGVVGLEAQFGQTMATLKATTGASSAEMKKFNDQAIKLGADTSFSAGEAAGAMLELAKAGLDTKTIMGGGVAGTLTLAAAGGTDLGTAATIASNALNTFNLRGKDMGSVAAALAGGANASSASVESLGEALGQVGPGARNAGLSVQETVAALAAFANAGIQGSDAGTSLKTMLTRLVPQTDKAANMMKDLGLKFTDSEGNFKSLANISGQLRRSLKGLSDEERTKALATMFGSDATRAATVLMNEGEKGIRKYIKATSNQSAAQKMASARMSGTAGALERLKGSVETVGLRLGQEMAPAVEKTANFLAANLVPATEKTIGTIKSVVGFIDRNRTSTLALVGVITALVVITKAHAAVMAVQAAGGLMAMLKATKLVSAATKVYAAVQWVLNAALTANPIGLIIVGLVALGAALVVAYKKSETFRKIVNGAFGAVKKAAMVAWNFIKAKWPLLLGILTGPVGLAVIIIIRNWGKVKAATAAVWNAIKGLVTKAWQGIKSGVANGASQVIGLVRGIPGKIRGLAGLFSGAGRALIGAFVDGMRNASGIVSGIAGNVWSAVKSLLNGAIGRLRSALNFSIPIPGPDIHVNVGSSIPYLAKGGIVPARPGGTLAVIGEAGHDEAVIPLSGPHAPKLRGGGGDFLGTFELVLKSPDGREIQRELLQLKRQTRKPLGLA